jgi:hypothetical protein
MLLRSGLLVASAAPASALPHHALFARVVDSSVASSTQYDFIVAAGGTAGLTVADRLTESPNGMLLSPSHVIFSVLTPSQSKSS